MTERDWLAQPRVLRHQARARNIGDLPRRSVIPSAPIRVVHVAGTNGKGSVAAMVERALRAAGHRRDATRRRISCDLEERFAVDGRPVDAGRARSARSPRPRRGRRAARRGAARGAEPTYLRGHDGGRLRDLPQRARGRRGRRGRPRRPTRRDQRRAADAATAITSIDFDHEAHLGTTLAAIAAEKAGIIKPGVPVVAGSLAGEALEVVEQTADASRRAAAPGDARVCRAVAARRATDGERPGSRPRDDVRPGDAGPARRAPGRQRGRGGRGARAPRGGGHPAGSRRDRRRPGRRALAGPPRARHCRRARRARRRRAQPGRRAGAGVVSPRGASNRAADRLRRDGRQGHRPDDRAALRRSRGRSSSRAHPDVARRPPPIAPARAARAMPPEHDRSSEPDVDARARDRVAATAADRRRGLALSCRRRLARLDVAGSRDAVALLAAESAWYRGRKLRRCVSIESCFVLLACAGLAVAPAGAAQDSATARRSRAVDAGHGSARTTSSSPARSRSTAATSRCRPTRSRCSHDTNKMIATGNVVFTQRHQPHRGRSARIQHRRRKPGTFYNALRHGDDAGAEGAARPRPARRSSARKSLFGGAGAGRLLLRREDLEDRRTRSTGSPRAASRPACSRRRAGSSRPARSIAQPRSLRAADATRCSR